MLWKAGHAPPKMIAMAATMENDEGRERQVRISLERSDPGQFSFFSSQRLALSRAFDFWDCEHWMLKTIGAEGEVWTSIL